MSLHVQRHKKKGQSLKHEIDVVERRLAGRKVAAKAHAAEIGETLRDNLSSPWTLLAATGVGFAVAHFRPWEHFEFSADAEAPAAAGGEAGQSTFGTIMDVLTLAGSLMAMFPRDGSAAAPEEGADA